MKRFLLLIALALFGCVSQMKSQDVLAQRANNDNNAKPSSKSQIGKKVVSGAKTHAVAKTAHMLFMGIPIDGSIYAFEQKVFEKKFHKSSIGSYSGYFYGQFCVADIITNDNTANVCEVEIRYNQLIAKYTEFQLKTLYDNIVRDLKKKYTNAKRDETSGWLVLTLPTGFIECRIFESILGKMGGGVNLSIRYVDKANSPDYKIPVLKRNEDDL